jgi:nitrous oxidase accessory protein
MGLRRWTAGWMIALVAMLTPLAIAKPAADPQLTVSKGQAQRPAVVVCPRCPVRRLTDALRQAPEGARIIVQSGLYVEGEIVVDKPVEIVGQGWPVFDGAGKNQVLTVRADGVHLTGLLIRNSGKSYIADLAGLRVEAAHHCVVEGNRLLNNFFGIYLASTEDCLIRDNEVHGNATSEAFSGNGIHLWNSHRITLERNHVTGHRDGLYFEFLQDSAVRDNISERNVRYGLHTMYSANNYYAGNLLRANLAGVVFMYSKRLRAIDNRYEDNWGAACYGALLKDLDDSEIAKNLFYHNSVALYAEDANRNLLVKNRFYNNGFAIRIMANANDNVFSGNLFETNSFDVTTNSSAASTNSFNGNYWDDYRGYDLNHDGIGDVPFWPVKLFGLLLEEYPAAIILLRSPFAELLDAAEEAIPILTPRNLADEKPLIARPSWSKPQTLKNASVQ